MVYIATRCIAEQSARRIAECGFETRRQSYELQIPTCRREGLSFENWKKETAVTGTGQERSGQDDLISSGAWCLGV